MLTNKQRFSEKLFTDSFGGGTRRKGTRGIAAGLQGCWLAGGIEMVSPKTEETLHIYIQRHFERVSKGTDKQFAEQEGSY